MKKRITALFLVCTMVSLLVAPHAGAAEMLPGKRWAYTSYLGNIKRCNLTVYAPMAGSRWESAVPTAISNWNNYSDMRVSITQSGTGGYNCFLREYYYDDLYNKMDIWPYGGYVAFTLLYDSNGKMYNGGFNVGGTSNGSELNNSITFAAVLFNPLHSTALSRTVTHELGHCMNLGHVDTNSIMVPVNSGDDKPTAMDRYYLSQMYN